MILTNRQIEWIKSSLRDSDSQFCSIDYGIKMEYEARIVRDIILHDIGIKITHFTFNNILNYNEIQITEE